MQCIRCGSDSRFVLAEGLCDHCRSGRARVRTPLPPLSHRGSRTHSIENDFSLPQLSPGSPGLFVRGDMTKPLSVFTVGAKFTLPPIPLPPIPRDVIEKIRHSRNHKMDICGICSGDRGGPLQTDNACVVSCGHAFHIACFKDKLKKAKGTIISGESLPCICPVRSASNEPFYMCNSDIKDSPCYAWSSSLL